MTNLTAIVKATRTSAKALQAAQKWARVAADEDLSFSVRYSADGKRKAAEASYARAQAILAANPLPGDTQ